jgi:ceramide glucosyltransferase
MEFYLFFLQGLLWIPIVAGSIYGILCLLAVRRFRVQIHSLPPPSPSPWPPVSVLKPVCGLEKNLKPNLRSACQQDYPDFQVVLAVQDPGDPAMPLLQEIQQEFPERVSVSVAHRWAGPNGKINNLLGALAQARHDILVISDSDVRLRPDYLKAIVAPLADPHTGFVCTLYKGTQATRWFERMDLLTLNADFIPGVIFAHVTGASRFCLGASVAFRRGSLEAIGGLESLSDYLAEDYEMGRRFWASGKRMALVPYFVDIAVDHRDLSAWWNHQLGWDQKTRAAQPVGFFATVVIRAVPFALLFAVCRLGDALGLAVLGGALGLRLATAAAILRWGLQDREGLKSLVLLPLRDLAALLTWVLALTKKTVVWRGLKLTLTHAGRLARQEPKP